MRVLARLGQAEQHSGRCPGGVTRRIREAFPSLQRGEWAVTSPASLSYNCIAWAANEVHRVWWPDPRNQQYWPPGSHREVTIEAFLTAFETLGFSRGAGRELEPGFEKVAIFEDTDGAPTHAARQLPSGEWTSKLGKAEDIRHQHLSAVEGEEYGTVAQVLRRALPEG